VIRRQLPVHSPVTPAALVAGAARTVISKADPLEQVLGRHYPDSHLVLCDSGTSALTLAILKAARGNDSPLIALPAYACYDLATAALGARGRVIFYDLSPDTLAPDLGSLEKTLENKPDVVVVAYWYGVTFDISVVAGMVARAGATLVEDAAQAFGGSVFGKACGTTAPLGVLSFGRGKGASGCAGGALLLNDDSYDGSGCQAEQWGWAGWAKSWFQWLLGRPGWYWLPAGIPMLRLGETVYHPPREIRGMARLHRQVLVQLFPAALAEAEARKENAARLAGTLEGMSEVQVVEAEAGNPSYLRMPVLSEEPRLRSREARRLGIMPGYPRSLAALRQLAGVAEANPADYPGAAALVDRLVTLPTHSLLQQRDFDDLVRLLG